MNLGGHARLSDWQLLPNGLNSTVVRGSLGAKQLQSQALSSAVAAEGNDRHSLASLMQSSGRPGRVGLGMNKPNTSLRQFSALIRHACSQIRDVQKFGHAVTLPLVAHHLRRNSLAPNCVPLKVCRWVGLRHLHSGVTAGETAPVYETAGECASVALHGGTTMPGDTYLESKRSGVTAVRERHQASGGAR